MKHISKADFIDNQNNSRFYSSKKKKCKRKKCSNWKGGKCLCGK